MTFRIFLDSKDLINLVRRSQPFDLATADKWLRERNAEIVLSHTSVSEFVPAATTDRLQVRWELQELERLPVSYIRLGDLRCPELWLAARAFAESRPYVPFDPYVTSFWRTFWNLIPEDGKEVAQTRELELRVNFRLDEQIFMLWTRPENFMNTESDKQSLQSVLDAYRKRTPRQRFREDVEAAMNDCNGSLELDLDVFVAWLQDRPRVAPAWRFFWQTAEELTLNTTDLAKPGDLHDLLHLSATPYVDAVTLDGRFRSYARQATRKLRSIDDSIDYDRRLFGSFEAIIHDS
jgi:hypothetical protein